MDTIEEFLKGIEEFSLEKNERAAVILAFSMLEQFVSDLLKIKCKHPEGYKNLSVSVKISLLHDIGEISNNEYESINWLRRQRNKAAHKPGYKVDRSGIQKKWIAPLLEKMDLLQSYLITAVGGFWNRHPEMREFYGIGNNT